MKFKNFQILLKSLELIESKCLDTYLPIIVQLFFYEN